MFWVDESVVNNYRIIQVSESTSNDHSWKEEATWNGDTIGGDSPEIPDATNDKKLYFGQNWFRIDKVSNESTFCFPKNCGKWVVFILLVDAPADTDIDVLSSIEDTFGFNFCKFSCAIDYWNASLEEFW
jgi:hypothetical protein